MTKFRFDRAASLTAAVLFAFALPAHASNTANSNATNRPSPDAAAQRTNESSDARQICVRVQLSGSHVTRRVCKTAQEWENAGGLPTDDDR